MRKLILEEWLTLDGYAADRNGKLDFSPAREENRRSDEDQLKFVESIDTMLIGRKTYELFFDFWPTTTTDQEMIADKLNGMQKVVFSNTLKKAPWGKWPEATVLGGDAVKEITKLKTKPGKDIILWGSISLAQTLMKAKLIDEYRLHYCAGIMGGGRQLFPESDAYMKLKLTGSVKYEESGAMLLLYKS